MKCGKKLVRGISHLALATAIATTGMAVMPGMVKQAEAKNLFEIMMEKHRERQRAWTERRRKKREARRKSLNEIKNPAPKPAVPVEKVKTPSYYAYKADGFSKLDMMALAAAINSSKLQDQGKGPDADHQVQTAAIEGQSVTDTETPVEMGGITTDGTAGTDPLKQNFLQAAQKSHELSVMVEKGMGPAIIKHYKDNPKFMWIGADGQPNEKARELLAVFGEADKVGLYPEDYVVLYSGKGPATSEISATSAMKDDEAAVGNDADRDDEIASDIEATDAGNNDFSKLAAEVLESAEQSEFAAMVDVINFTPSAQAALVQSDVADEGGEAAKLETVQKEEAQKETATSDGSIAQASEVSAWEDETRVAAINFELEMTARALRYMADSQNGIINPNRISGYHDFSGLVPNYHRLISHLADSNDVVALMDDMQPDGPAFKALVNELASLSGSDDEIDVEIAKGTLIKPGADSAELPKVVKAIGHYGSDKLKEKHGELLNSYVGSTNYDKPLVQLVKDFQQENGLGADGVVGRNTIARLHGQSSPVKISRVKMALERLRWQPDELGKRHVFINQPAYTATYLVDYKSRLSMRAIIGKKSNQTSFFNDQIETVVYNPYWGVPRSILVNEMLPKLRANPAYLDNAGYEVTNVKGQKVSSASINWNAVGSRPPYDVRQLPGAKNALGELKILFPNKHAIYMHDTPSRGLFSRKQRALSHGCVRLHKPRDMAAAVLGKDVKHVASKLAAGHGQEAVSGKIPVYVAYFTAWPNDAGKVQYFGDVYGRDGTLGKAIATTRKVRDAALKQAEGQG